MAWLPFVDTVLPIGDIIYFGGIVVIGWATYEVVEEVVQTSPSLEEPKTPEKEKVTTGDPPTEADGYKAPKGGAKKGKTKDGKTGWVDKYGNIWVPAPTGSANAHGGGHWDVQRSDGKGYSNVYPGGHLRKGGGKPPILPLLK